MGDFIIMLFQGGFFSHGRLYYYAVSGRIFFTWEILLLCCFRADFFHMGDFIIMLFQGGFFFFHIL